MWKMWDFVWILTTADDLESNIYYDVKLDSKNQPITILTVWSRFMEGKSLTIQYVTSNNVQTHFKKHAANASDHFGTLYIKELHCTETKVLD